MLKHISVAKRSATHDQNGSFAYLSRRRWKYCDELVCPEECMNDIKLGSAKIKLFEVVRTVRQSSGEKWSLIGNLILSAFSKSSTKRAFLGGCP
jgi:hypothetical protein